jgi:hypothetical protein
MRIRHDDASEFRRYIARPKVTGCRPAMLRFLAVIAGLLGALLAPASAQDVPRSECLAMAETSPRATPVSLRRPAKADEVEITYAGHSTYYIDTPGGVRIATDFSGAYTTGRLPDVITMNRAHALTTPCFPTRAFLTCCTAGERMASRRRSPSASATSTSAM